MFKRNANLLSVLTPYVKYISWEWRLQLLALILSCISIAAVLALPLLTKTLIDKVLLERNGELLIWIVFGMFGLMIVRLVLSVLSRLLSAHIGRNIMLKLRGELAAKIIEIPYFNLRNFNAADLSYRAMTDCGNVQKVLTQTLLNVVKNGLRLVIIVGILGWMNLKLLFICVIGLPFFLVIAKFTQAKLLEYTQMSTECKSRLTARFVETYQNLKVVQAFAQGANTTKDIKKEVGALGDLEVKRTVFGATRHSCSSFFLGLGPILVLLVGAHDVLEEDMTVGALVAFGQYINWLVEPVRKLGGVYTTLVEGSVSLRRIEELENLHLKDTIELAGERRNRPECSRITMRKVSAGYHGGLVLHDIDLDLKRGMRYALVGENGSGKTTLVNMVCGLLDPMDGEIAVHSAFGKDSIKLKDLNIGMVPQETLLFNRPVLDNVLYGKQEEVADADRILHSLRIPELVTEKASGATIGDNGARLSGGQRQRVCIARALMSDPDILVIDEGTSMVDGQMEESVLELLETRKNMFTIVVSHNVEVIERMDWVFCIENGRIVEEGTPAEMKRKGKHFQQLFALDGTEEIQGRRHFAAAVG